MESMDEERFERLIEAYGGESARWPQAERALALRYLAATPQAHGTRATARRLDQMLDAWAPPEASAGLRERIGAGQPSVRPLRARDLWISAAGLAAACVIGLMFGAGVGAAGLGPAHEGDNATATVNAALDGSSAPVPVLDEEWS